MTKLVRRVILGLVFAVFVSGCAVGQKPGDRIPTSPVTVSGGGDSLWQEMVEDRLSAVETQAQTAFREGRGFQAEVLPRLGNVEEKMGDYEKRLSAIEKWRRELTGEALHMREQLQKQGQTQSSVSRVVRKGEIVHGLRNITSWELSWSGNQLVAASEKRLTELQRRLSDGDELVSIVAFCGDMKVRAKCDVSVQKAGVVAERLKVTSSFVERQPGNEAVTVAFTVRRNK